MLRRTEDVLYYPSGYYTHTRFEERLYCDRLIDFFFCFFWVQLPIYVCRYEYSTKWGKSHAVLDNQLDIVQFKRLGCDNLYPCQILVAVSSHSYNYKYSRERVEVKGLISSRETLVSTFYSCKLHYPHNTPRLVLQDGRRRSSFIN